MSFLDTTTMIQKVITEYAVQPLLILFLGIFVAKLVDQIIQFVLQELHVSRRKYEVAALTTKWIIYITAVLLSLRSIGLLAITLWTLVTISAIVIGLSILLGLRDFFPNFLAYHRVQKHKPGTSLRFSFGEATIIKVQLTDMHVKLDKDDIYIPNSSVEKLLD